MHLAYKALAATVAAGALVFAGASASTHAVPRGSSAAFDARARVALERYLAANKPLNAPAAHGVKPGGTVLPVSSNAAASFNWSGYADTSTTAGEFTAVSGKWVTPAVRCGREDQLTSEWVGLDGFGTETVEQDGTISWCFEHHPVYFTWYEMYPAGTVEVGTTLRPYDRIAASVTDTAGSYSLKLTDYSHPADSFAETATCAAATCLDESAEWIAERPAFSIGIAPLAEYWHWALADGAETAGGVAGTIGSGPGSTAITMEDATASYPLSVPSPLLGGTAFATSWRNSW